MGLLLVAVDGPEQVPGVVGALQAALDPGDQGLLLEGCGLNRVVVAGLKPLGVPESKKWLY